MFRSLFRNVAISAVAYSAVSAVALLLAPLLIHTYGLAGFGQIVIARLFVPSAALGILDLGTSEVTTQVVVKARQGGDWRQASRRLTLLGIIALCCGLIAGTAVICTAPFMPEWMSVAVVDQPGFVLVLFTTGLLLPLLFLSLLFEGILKGFEDFKALRGCEVVAATSYGALAILCVWRGGGVDWVCYALLGSLLIRLACAAFLAVNRIGHDTVKVDRWSRSDRDFVFGWARVMAANKVLGALQNQAAAPLIGLLFGPAAVGAVDALSRLPRFLKSVLGLLNSTVLPVAAGLEHLKDGAGLRRLGEQGLLLITFVSVPPMVAAMALSEPVTRLWLGPALAAHWYWQSLLFIVPATNTLVSFGGSILLARRTATADYNRIILLQVVVQIASSLALTIWFGQWAFVLGQVIAVAFTFLLQMRLIGRELAFSPSAFLSLVRVTLVSIVLGVVLLPEAGRITSVWQLLLAGSAWCAITWLACLAVALPPGAQGRIIELAREAGLVPRKGGRMRMPISAALSRRARWILLRSPLAALLKRFLQFKARKRLQARKAVAATVSISPQAAMLADSICRDGYAIVTPILDKQLLAELGAAGEIKLQRLRDRTPTQLETHKTYWTRLLDEDGVDGSLPADNPFVAFAIQRPVLEVLVRAFGDLPILASVMLTLSQDSGDSLSYSQLWHLDYDDVRVIKLFVYLTDVQGPADGPFTFLPAQPSGRFGFSVKSRRPDAEVARKAKEDEIKSVTAPRLSAFVVETSRCLHMGSRMAAGHERLLYAATFMLPPRLVDVQVPLFRLTGREDLVSGMVLQG